MQKPPDSAEDERPLVVPCATLGIDAPLRWLRLGWQDLQRAPRLTLLFGSVIMLVSVLGLVRK